MSNEFLSDKLIEDVKGTDSSSRANLRPELPQKECFQGTLYFLLHLKEDVPRALLLHVMTREQRVAHHCHVLSQKLTQSQAHHHSLPITECQ